MLTADAIVHEVEADVTCTASMGPRFVNRGCAHLVRYQVTAEICFNGAAVC